MLIQTLWTAAMSCLFLVAIISGLAGSFYLYGHFFMKRMRLPDLGSDSYIIAVGMTVTIFLGWYVYKAGLSIDHYIAVVFSGAIVLLLFELINNRKKIRQYMQLSTLSSRPLIIVIPLFALLFAVQALIAFRSATYPIGSIGNNDIYTWSILADQLLGSAGYWHVFPDGKNVMALVEIDAWGTVFSLAEIAKLLQVLAMEAAPYFIVFCLVLIASVLFELIKRVFKFNSFVSFMIALLTSGGAFFFYIAYNYFFGELLATFFYLVVIFTLYHLIDCSQRVMITDRSLLPLAEELRMRVTKKALVLTVPLLGIFLVYQSGFLAFVTFSLLLCVLSVSAIHIKKPFLLIKELIHWFGLVFCACLFIACLLPELAVHTVRRTLLVASAGAGWPLGLISPFYLFSLPCKGTFPGQLGHYLVQYGVVLFVAFSLLFLFYRLAKSQNSKRTSSQLGLILYFCFSLLIYYVLYFLKGDTYQVWKLLAYVELPISFIFLSVLIAPFYYSKTGTFFQKSLPYGLAFMCFFVVTMQPVKMHLSLDSLSSGLTHLKRAKTVLDQQVGIDQIVLATRPYGETMTAFNLLAKDYKLYPLSTSYLAPAGPELIKQLDEKRTYVLQCAPEEKGGFGNGDYTLVPLKEFLRGSLRDHSFHNDVLTLDEVYLLKGFSVPEPWGVWTEGNQAHLQTKIPTDLISKKIVVLFEVKPFIAGQTFSARVNGHFLGSWVLRTTEMTTLSMRIPRAATQQDKLDFYFDVDHPVSPRELSTYADDTRKLGIGFSSFKLVSDS